MLKADYQSVEKATSLYDITGNELWSSLATAWIDCLDTELQGNEGIKSRAF